MELILNTYGSALVKQNNNFVVLHKDGNQTIHPDKIRSISISKGAQISSDAVLLAIQNEIDVLFIEQNGKPTGRVWSVKYGSISTIRRKQLDFTFSNHAISWIKDIVKHKIDNQTALLLSLTADNEKAETIIKRAINKLAEYNKKIAGLQGEVISDIAASLRGWEGAASKAYFNAINEMMPKAYRFNGRSQHPATDIFNCLLNYGYGMLYGKIEGALIKAGIDPYIGVFHRDDYNRPVLVFDIIELYRVWVDYVVISLCMQQVIDDDCYSIKPDNSYWLEGLGKRIIIQSINDYLNEVIKLNGIDRSRQKHIELYAQNLATMFIKMKN